MLNFPYFLFIVIIGCFTVVAQNKRTLQQIHVVFRHGDRNPEKASLYPTDPNLNDTWAPDGFGQLTMYGKMQEYNIGRALRKRYDQFLGKIYTSDVIDPISTNYNRTKMSLELVLAGLYPPVPSQTWNMLLPWQPIPYNYVSWENDAVMRFAYYYCKKYTELFYEAMEEEIFQEYWTNHADLIKYVGENSGLEMKTVLDLFRIYDALNAEVRTGRKIPAWTAKIFPEFLTTAGDMWYTLQTYNDELLKHSGGHMVKKIIADARAKKDGTLSPKDRKIFLYSGHEYNVAYILGALKVFKPHIPPYGSYVIVELHKIGNVYGFKVLYQDYTHSSPQYVTVPGCDTFCPFDKFIELTETVIPEADIC